MFDGALALAWWVYGVFVVPIVVTIAVYKGMLWLLTRNNARRS